MTIRAAQDPEAATLANLYLASFRAACPGIKLAHSDDDIRTWFHDHLLPETETWAAADAKTLT